MQTVPSSLRVLTSRFEIRQKLGAGGMSEVYLANDRQTSTPIALKVLLPHLRDDEMIAERFRREVAAVRRISHPNVATIYELIETPEVLCLVLEYNSGIDMKRLLRRQTQLPPEVVTKIAIKVLGALEAAHQRGVIHRDIKPHNIMIGRDHDVKVVDFGLARIDDMVGLSTHTISVGTPEYMAPELMLSTIVDGRADLYALGVTMYEAVTGKLPYSAATPLALMHAHQSGEFEDPRSIVSCPDYLAEAILRAMQTEPEDRFSTAREMRQALEARAVTALRELPDGRCQHCDARLVTGLEFCVECGRDVVVIREQPGASAAVAVKGRFFSLTHTDKDWLTYKDKNMIVDFLDQAGGVPTKSVQATDKALKVFPSMLATGIRRHDAEYLGEKLEQMGIPVRVYTGGVLSTLRRWIDFFDFSLWFVRIALFMVFFAVPVMIAVQEFGWQMVLVPAGWLLGMWMLVRLYLRLRPAVSFEGDAGYALSNDELANRARAAFAKIETPRVRQILYRVLERGIELRQQMEAAEWAPASMISDIDSLMFSALDIGARVGAVDASARKIDARAVHERLAVVEELLVATADPRESESLIREKVELTDLLTRYDEAQDEIARLSSGLLSVSADLESMDQTLLDFESANHEAVSVILGNMETQLEAYQELEGFGYELGQAAEVDATVKA